MVTDENDNPPEFDPTVYDIKIPEDTLEGNCLVQLIFAGSLRSFPHSALHVFKHRISLNLELRRVNIVARYSTVCTFNILLDIHNQISIARVSFGAWIFFSSYRLFEPLRINHSAWSGSKWR